MRTHCPVRFSALVFATLFTCLYTAIASGDDRAPEAVATAVKAKDLVDAKAVGANRGRSAYRQVPAKGWVLIGFDVGVGPAVGKDAIVTIRPLFLTADGDQVLGDEVGNPPDLGGPLDKRRARITSVVKTQAKPGYAVSGISVQAGLWIDSLRITYAKIDGDHLDLKDTYTSEWAGTKDRRGEVSIDSGGRLVVGIAGKTEPTQVMNIVLVHLTKPAPPEKLPNAPPAATDKSTGTDNPPPARPKPVAPAPEKPKRVSPAPPPQQTSVPVAAPTLPPVSQPSPTALRDRRSVPAQSGLSGTGPLPTLPGPDGAPALLRTDSTGTGDPASRLPAESATATPTPSTTSETESADPSANSDGVLRPALVGLGIAAGVIGIPVLVGRVRKSIRPTEIPAGEEEMLTQASGRELDEVGPDPGGIPPGPGDPLGLARPGLLLLLISLGLYLGSLGLHSLLLTAAWAGAVVPNGLVLVTGLLGLANWVVGLVGLSLCIAGPARVRGLAITATSVAVVHVILAFVVANDTKSLTFTPYTIETLSGINRMDRVVQTQKTLEKESEKDPKSAASKELREELAAMQQQFQDEFRTLLNGNADRSRMRWGDLTTLYPTLDKVGAVLSYQSKGFSDYLPGFFAGLGELARFVLIVLLVGSLAPVSSSRDAREKVKLGLIGGCVATGVGIGFSLLAAMMIDRYTTEAQKPQTAVSLPSLPNLKGATSIQEVQRLQTEWHRHGRAEVEKREEKQKSFQRGIKNWAAGSDLLVYALHAGMLILPAVLVVRVYSAVSPRAG
ncbi:MAG: hypothetical protein JWO38_6079 [Gemmataceae bacterium]|nr:hypothetical protein [Gemmataceae bacterium]